MLTVIIDNKSEWNKRKWKISFIQMEAYYSKPLCSKR